MKNTNNQKRNDHSTPVQQHGFMAVIVSNTMSILET